MSFIDLPADVVSDAARSGAALPQVTLPSCVPALVPAYRKRLTTLHDVCRVRMYDDSITDGKEFLRRVEGADLAVIAGFHIADDVLRRMAGRVRCLVFSGTGIASFVNVPLARELGVTLCNAEHYGDASVAEHAVALLFEIARRVGRQNASLHAGDWFDEGGMLQLEGLTIGLAGFGGVGQAVARIADGLGMRVKVWCRHPDPALLARYRAESVPTLADLFASSDVVSLHLALNEATRGMIGPRELDLLRPGSILINTARAELIAPGALVERLSCGDVQAGVDVYDHEPLAPDDPILALGNVVATPHTAWKTARALDNVAAQNAETIRAFYAGAPEHVVA
ncbi:NAD(P)-dependent oxidoreductase [Bifidobacterium avesanii]|uniref:D-2-hydroxyacid dehydrogenase family protein n=1 Tax=Bifidobacterium avesanii TaxID=1798157 RepID=A0A7K3TGA3_9BIFI|nr:NAD(P)-dependent oxidoreductase [Bifidobacterium avesanii]KAB8294610.1 2-hydroxyacid dehydrogenase [Bifidobacterium avesanii]NEG78118.1 D-2-hydroxyacid dehydrogenase family protein [Bifidobacterium avesanii]